jgi:hypothetical protein
MTSSGLKPTTFQLVADCLNQLCSRVPHIHLYLMVITITMLCCQLKMKGLIFQRKFVSADNLCRNHFL